MPKLPSGRHVAVVYSPRLRSWIKTVGKQHVHQFLCLEKPEHVYPWIEVLYLVPDEKGMRLSTEQYHCKGGKPPAGHHSVYSGYTLAQWSWLTKSWSQEDREAMRLWVEAVVEPEFVYSLLGRVKDSEKNGSGRIW